MPAEQSLGVDDHRVEDGIGILALFGKEGKIGLAGRFAGCIDRCAQGHLAAARNIQGGISRVVQAQFLSRHGIGGLAGGVRQVAAGIARQHAHRIHGTLQEDIQHRFFHPVDGKAAVASLDEKGDGERTVQAVRYLVDLSVQGAHQLHQALVQGNPYLLGTQR